MARLLASSRYAAGLLLRAPEDAVAMLADDGQLAPAAKRRPCRRKAAAATAHACAGRGRRRGRRTGAAPPGTAAHGRAEVRPRARTVRHEETGEALSTVAAVTVAAALDVAVRTVEQETGPLPTRMAVLAMGRFGGHEMGYASDADVMFVHDPRPGAEEESATRAAHAVAEELRRMLSRPGPDPALPVDACAAGGPTGAADPHAGLVPGLLPPVVAPLGGAGTAARRARRGRSRARRCLHHGGG